MPKQEERKRRGRPRGPRSNDGRVERINISLHPSNREALDAVAAGWGVTVSEAIRRMIAQQVPVAP